MDSTNRKINRLFLSIAKNIYESDIRNGDTKTWWPIRPTRIDFPLAPFLFSELIHLFRLCDKAGRTDSEIAKLFPSSDAVYDLQFLWPSLGWKPTTLTLEDRFFLIEKLIAISEIAPTENSYIPIFTRLGNEIKQTKNTEEKNVLRQGTRLYLEYLKGLYESLGENWEEALETATKLVLEKQKEAVDPGPWGNDSQDKAIRQIVRNSDFRREKEKNLEQIIQGVPEIPGIAEGVVGENIIVGFTIRDIPDEADAFITNVAAFNMLNVKDELTKKGIVVVSKTRSGTRILKNGDKVLVDSTSGIVFKLAHNL